MAQSQDERAARRLLKRAMRRRDQAMISMLVGELGIILAEQAGEADPDKRVGPDIHMARLKRSAPISGPRVKTLAEVTG